MIAPGVANISTIDTEWLLQYAHGQEPTHVVLVASTSPGSMILNFWLHRFHFCHLIPFSANFNMHMNHLKILLKLKILIQ